MNEKYRSFAFIFVAMNDIFHSKKHYFYHTRANRIIFAAEF